MTGVVETAIALREKADRAGVGQKRSSLELYRILAGCMALAMRCRDPDEAAALRRLVLDRSRGEESRSYVEAGSDEFVLVCRYVFSSGSASANRSNASRYASALREAAVRQIRPEDLSRYLRHNGGINALFLTRPLAALAVTTRTLRLNSPVTVPKGAAFTLTFRRRPDGTFDVIHGESDDPPRP